MENQNHQCNECLKTYKSSASLATHKYKVHSKKEHTCRGCNINLSSNNSLSRHQKTCSLYKECIQKEEKEKESQDKTKQAEMEVTIKFLKEQVNDKDKQLQDKDKLIEVLYNKIDQSETSRSIMYKDTIESKNKLYEVSNRSHQIQTSMMNQVNSNNNNNINVIVQNQSDIDLARKLIPISNENLANACLSVLNQYTDNYNQTIYKPSVFYSDLINTPELKNSIVKTDQSRNISAWINQDENNTLIKDKNARKLLLKLTQLPKENKTVYKKIDEIIQLNCAAKSTVDTTNKDQTLTFVEEFNDSNLFFNYMRLHKKVPEKSLKIYEKILSDYIPDRTDLLIQSNQDLEELHQCSEKECKELGDFTEMYKAITDILLKDKLSLYMMFFCSIEDLGTLFRKLFCDIYERDNSIFSILIYSEQIEDRKCHTIYYSQDHNAKVIKNKLNRSQLIAICKNYLRSLFSIDWFKCSEMEKQAFDCINIDKNYSMEEKMMFYLCKKDWCVGPVLMDKNDYIQVDHKFLKGCLEIGDFIQIRKQKKQWNEKIDILDEEYLE